MKLLHCAHLAHHFMPQCILLAFGFLHKQRKKVLSFSVCFFIFYFFAFPPSESIPVGRMGRGTEGRVGLPGCVIAFCVTVEFKWIQYCIFTLKCAQKQIFHLHFLNDEIRITYTPRVQSIDSASAQFRFPYIELVRCMGRGVAGEEVPDKVKYLPPGRRSKDSMSSRQPATSTTSTTGTTYTYGPFQSLLLHSLSMETPLAFCMLFVRQRIRFRTFRLL